MIVVNLVLFIFTKLQGEVVLPAIGVIIAINLLTIGLTILMAHWSFKYYENFFLNLKSNFRKEKKNEIIPIEKSSIPASKPCTEKAIKEPTANLTLEVKEVFVENGIS
jgi:hypothetical protein